MTDEAHVAQARGELQETLGRMAEGIHRLKDRLTVTRLGLSIDEDLLTRIHRHMSARGQFNQSQAVRDLIDAGLRRSGY